MTQSTAAAHTRPRVSFAFNRRIAFLRFVTLSNGLILFFLLLCLFIPETPTGFLAPLIQDVSAALPSLPPFAIRSAAVMGIGFVLCGDISQSLRRLPPSYFTLATLSGQTMLFLIALVYTVSGRLPLLALYGK